MDHTDLNTTQETLTVPSELVIPEISDERLQELYSQIRPIVDIDGEKFTMKAYSLNEIKNTSYFWNRRSDKRDFVDTEMLEVIQDFACLHRMGQQYRMFKPSITEVLSQMPEEIAEQSDYFEIVESPETTDDLNRQRDILNAGFHLSRVRAYRVKDEE